MAADKSTTTLNNGITVKWTINPNDNNNYQNKLDEGLPARWLSLQWRSINSLPFS